MQNVNTVGINFIMERYKSEELPNVNVKESQIKEWIYEAMRKIGSLELYEMYRDELVIKKGQVRIPSYINNVAFVLDENLERMVQVDEETGSYTSKNYYLMRGRYIRVPFDSGKINVDYFKFPTDDKGNPEIVDNEYVISAIIAFIAFKAAKRLWITNRINTQKYNDFEQEWLFYVNSASESLNTSSFDSVLGMGAFETAFPLSRLSGQ